MTAIRAAGELCLNQIEINDEESDNGSFCFNMNCAARLEDGRLKNVN